MKQVEKSKTIIVYSIKIVEDLVRAGARVLEVLPSKKYDSGLIFRIERNNEIDVLLREKGILISK